MTQTLSNYQETVNTLLFGQKAKNIKTTVNINEIAIKSGSEESSSYLQLQLARSNKMIIELE